MILFGFLEIKQYNYIKAFASETDQYEYMNDMYHISAKALKKNLAKK